MISFFEILKCNLQNIFYFFATMECLGIDPTAQWVWVGHPYHWAVSSFSQDVLFFYLEPLFFCNLTFLYDFFSLNICLNILMLRSFIWLWCHGDVRVQLDWAIWLDPVWKTLDFTCLNLVFKTLVLICGAAEVTLAKVSFLFFHQMHFKFLF